LLVYAILFSPAEIGKKKQWRYVKVTNVKEVEKSHTVYGVYVLTEPKHGRWSKEAMIEEIAEIDCKLNIDTQWSHIQHNDEYGTWELLYVAVSNKQQLNKFVDMINDCLR